MEEECEHYGGYARVPCRGGICALIAHVLLFRGTLSGVKRRLPVFSKAQKIKMCQASAESGTNPQSWVVAPSHVTELPGDTWCTEKVYVNSVDEKGQG